MNDNLDKEQISDFLETQILDKYDEYYIVVLFSQEYSVTGLIVRSSKSAINAEIEFEVMSENRHSQMLNELKKHPEISKIKTSGLIDFYDNDFGFNQIFMDYTSSGQFQNVQYNRLPNSLLMALQ